MKSREKTPATPITTEFSLLRARLESALPSAAVYAITSSTSGDGREFAARGLAYAFASAGYRTIFIDASLNNRDTGKPTQASDFEEVVRSFCATPPSGALGELVLSDATVQLRTGSRSIEAAVRQLRATFDYIIICTEPGLTTPFGASITSVADGVLVSIKAGRRVKTVDSQLGRDLDRLGEAFLGVITVDPSLAVSPSSAALSAYNGELRRSKPLQAEVGA